MNSLNERVSTPRPERPAPRGRQRGITMFGLAFWAILIGFVGYLVVRARPTVNEYATIQRTVDKIAKEQPATVAAARASGVRRTLSR